VADRTVHNIFQNVNTFFLQNPLQQVTPESMSFTPDQWKTLWNKTLTYVEPEVGEYSEEETKELFEACNENEGLVWKFFIVTGMRKQEVANCAWSDFNPSQGTVSLTENINRELGVEFVPKDYEERTLRLTKDVIAALKKRRKAHSSDYLIFPNADGKPNGHFLRDLQDLALRATLNCGHCTVRRPKNSLMQGQSRLGKMGAARVEEGVCLPSSPIRGRRADHPALARSLGPRNNPEVSQICESRDQGPRGQA